MTDSIGNPWLWCGFIAFVLAMLALDLGVFHRKSHAVGFREAAIWSGVWVSLALLFDAGLWWRFGGSVATDFLTGYLIEKSLSVDNIFVFVVIFTAMGIPSLHQHRVLFWGILSALGLRAAMIVGGVALLERFSWLVYVFGAFLIVTGIKLFVQRNKEDHPEQGVALRLVRRVIPATHGLRGASFFVKESGRLLATPLLLALAMIEVSDVVFALDSIPAIFAVTRDPFIVFTSNIFALLGLRSLYFLLASAVEKFRYLKIGLAGVLVFVGAKMALVDLLHLPSFVSLLVIAALLGASIVASIRVARRESSASNGIHSPGKQAAGDGGSSCQSGDSVEQGTTTGSLEGRRPVA